MPVHFGEFTYDESRRLLLRGEKPVHLSPKAFQLLSILLTERPRAVSKKDLFDRLWPERVVSEGNLASAVAELRSALDDDPHAPRFIRTLYGFGYSFTAAVDENGVQKPVRSRWKIAAYAASASIALLLLILALRSGQSPRVDSTPPIRSLAVLPFDTTAST